MAAIAETSVKSRFTELIQGGVGAPILLLGMLAMVILPLPPILLDMFFTCNYSA
ncbi:MAG: hypothetical protein KZQ68_02255 [gamma proteobacterium symbiont of Bathyaustriella thionipta]|nr:hypothetical protein [gamma proteobacterium symbiont of Bathyaustriella thionipta]